MTNCISYSKCKNNSKPNWELKKAFSDQNRLDSVTTVDTLYKTIPATLIIGQWMMHDGSLSTLGGLIISWLYQPAGINTNRLYKYSTNKSVIIGRAGTQLMISLWADTLRIRLADKSMMGKISLWWFWCKNKITKQW